MTTKPKKGRSFRSFPAKTTPISMRENSAEFELARRVVKPSYTLTTALFPSTKMGTNFPILGLPELGLHYHLEFDPDIVWYKPQPEWITLEVDGKLVEHCPDFLCKTQSGYSYYLEAKGDEEAQSPEVKARTNAAKAYAKARGMGYVLLTSSEIRREPKVSNSKLIFRHVSDRKNPIMEEKIIGVLEKGPAQIRDIAAKIGSAIDATYGFTLHLASKHVVQFDMEKMITVNSVATLNSAHMEGK